MTEQDLENRYDFFRRLNGRLTAQYNKNKQLKENLENIDKRNKNKFKIAEAKVYSSNELIYELEFLKSCILDDFINNP